jgi:hypothetical protein
MARAVGLKGARGAIWSTGPRRTVGARSTIGKLPPAGATCHHLITAAVYSSLHQAHATLHGPGAAVAVGAAGHEPRATNGGYATSPLSWQPTPKAASRDGAGEAVATEARLIWCCATAGAERYAERAPAACRTGGWALTEPITTALAAPALATTASVGPAAFAAAAAAAAAAMLHDPLQWPARCSEASPLESRAAAVLLHRDDQQPPAEAAVARA